MAWLGWLDRGRGRVVATALSDVGAGVAASPPGVVIDDLLRHLHVRTPSRELVVGAEAVATLARCFPLTWLVGWMAGLPGLSHVAARLYGWIAANRYSLSRCRGGACRSVRQDLVRERAAGRAFSVCRSVGWSLIGPLAAFLFVRRLALQLSTWRRTRRRVATLMNGRLSIHFLGGGVSATVALLFGELFTMIRYGSMLVDPGGTRMRRSVARHLRGLDQRIDSVVTTHAHEEHVGNIEMAARATGACIRAHARAIPMLAEPWRIGRMRSLVIGQPAPVRSPVERLGDELVVGGDRADRVLVIETPGHSPEHVSFYVPRDRLLIAGDAFMGTHFSSPNDDVDHHAWIRALERLLALDIDVMVEAHGHVHTVRDDVLRDLERAGLGCIASRQEPRKMLQRKLDFLRWVGEQIALGAEEGLPQHGIRATVFPWTQRWSYESVVQDALAALVSGRAFGRHKVVRSFRASSSTREGLPAVYELRW